MLGWKCVTILLQAQSGWKVPELSENSMGKYLHKLFQTILNELYNSLPNLGASGSEVSHFIPEPRFVSNYIG